MQTGETLELISILKAAYPHQDLPAATVELFCRLLSDIPFQAGKAAVLSLITDPETQFMPSPGQLRARCIDYLDPLPTPEEAWLEVIELWRDGAFFEPQFSNRLITETVKALGHRALRHDPYPMRRDFLTIYRHLLETYRREQRMLSTNGNGRALEIAKEPA